MTILAFTSIGVMLAMSAYTYLRVRPGLARLPMQWSLKGRINWTAPRPVALLVTPVLFIALLIGLPLIVGANDNATVIPMLAFLGPLCHLLHIVLIATRADG